MASSSESNLSLEGTDMSAFQQTNGSQEDHHRPFGLGDEAHAVFASLPSPFVSRQPTQSLLEVGASLTVRGDGLPPVQEETASVAVLPGMTLPPPPYSSEFRAPVSSQPLTLVGFQEGPDVAAQSSTSFGAVEGAPADQEITPDDLVASPAIVRGPSGSLYEVVPTMTVVGDGVGETALLPSANPSGTRILGLSTTLAPLTEEQGNVPMPLQPVSTSTGIVGIQAQVPELELPTQRKEGEAEMKDFESINRKLESYYRSPLIFFRPWYEREVELDPASGVYRHFRWSGAWAPQFIADVGGMTRFLVAKIQHVVVPKEIKVFQRGRSHKKQENKIAYLSSDKRLVYLSNDEGDVLYLPPCEKFPDGTVLIKVEADFTNDRAFLLLGDQPASEEQLLDLSLQNIASIRCQEYEAQIKMEVLPDWAETATMPRVLKYFNELKLDVLPDSMLSDLDPQRVRADLSHLLDAEDLAILEAASDAELLQTMSTLAEEGQLIFTQKRGAIGGPWEEVSRKVEKTSQNRASEVLLEADVMGTDSTSFIWTDQEIPSQQIAVKVVPIEVIADRKIVAFNEVFVPEGCTPEVMEMSHVASNLRTLGHSQLLRCTVEGDVYQSCIDAKPTASSMNLRIKGNDPHGTMWRESQEFHVSTEVSLWVPTTSAHPNERLFLKDVNRQLIAEHCRYKTKLARVCLIKGVHTSRVISRQLEQEGESLCFPYLEEVKGKKVLRRPKNPVGFGPLDATAELPPYVWDVCKYGEDHSVYVTNCDNLVGHGFHSVKIMVHSPDDQFPLPKRLNVELLKEAPNKLESAAQFWSRLTAEGTLNDSIAAPTITVVGDGLAKKSKTSRRRRKQPQKGGSNSTGTGKGPSPPSVQTATQASQASQQISLTQASMASQQMATGLKMVVKNPDGTFTEISDARSYEAGLQAGVRSAQAATQQSPAPGRAGRAGRGRADGRGRGRSRGGGHLPLPSQQSASSQKSAPAPVPALPSWEFLGEWSKCPVHRRQDHALDLRLAHFLAMTGGNGGKFHPKYLADAILPPNDTATIVMFPAGREPSRDYTKIIAQW